MTRMISRQEAAKLLDCHPQTVTNWVEKGVIIGHKIGGFLMVDRDSISQYFDSLKDLADMEQNLADMKKEIQEKTKEMKATLEELRVVVLPSDRVKLIFRESQKTLIDFWGWILRDREREILTRTTMGERPEVIADELGLTRERVIQIGVKAAWRISDVSDLRQLFDEIEDLERENENLQIENEKLNRKIANMSYRLEEYERDKKLKSTILQKRISDLPFSARTLNGLRSLGCETLGDLVKLDKLDLMKARNFGMKSLGEIDDYLIKNCLHLGMKLDLMTAEELTGYNSKNEG